ncbi:MAG: TIGR02099 family protein, partial [Pseudomonadota bacterium]
DRGSIRLNASAANNATNTNELTSNVELGNVKGLQVYGNLDYLDADAWRNVMQDFSGSSKQSPALPIQKLAIKINTLDIFDRRINQLKISNNSDKDGLHANIQSKEISGDLQWISQNNGKLIARLSNLTIPEPAPNRTKTKEVAAKEFFKLEQDYPSLDITADNLPTKRKLEHTKTQAQHT